MAEHAGQETILLVEDQPDVGDYAQEVLEEFGYRVLRAGNGPEALELLDRAGQVSLLFTDLIMPGGMNGVVLAREARSRRPRIKVLLTTGYAENSLERVDARGSEFDVINKPYKRSELAAKVRQTLDGPTGVG
jgi:CheY-like chemotaxis protein